MPKKVTKPSFPKFLTTVTPFSKMLALAMFVVLPIAGFFLGKYYGTSLYHTDSLLAKNEEMKAIAPVVTPTSQQQKPAPEQITQSASENTFELIGGCDKTRCLFSESFNDSVIGYGMLEGYFTTYEKLDWGDTKTSCTAFVLKGGDIPLIENFKEWINDGNSINILNEDNEVVLNINLEELPIADQEAIRTSNAQNQVTLQVIRRMPRGQGVGSCTSFVDILSVSN